MHRINVGNLEIEVTQKNINNLRLSVSAPNGRIRVSLPLRMTDDAVRRFVLSKLAWIHKQQLKFQVREPQLLKSYFSGEVHFLNGKPYSLNVIIIKGTPKVEIRNSTDIDLFVREGSTMDQREKVMKEWYRTRLKEQIPPLIEHWQPVIGVKVDDWGVKLMKTRWGTCNISKKRIWLNLELAKKTNECVEYIVVHEMVHLLEQYHNHHFKGLMDKFLPKWRDYKAELNSIVHD